jgi:hypothetical protein
MEYRRRWRRRLPLVVGFLLVHGLAVAVLALRVWQRGNAVGLDETRTAARILVATSMFCCAVVVLAAPLFTVGALLADRRSETQRQALRGSRGSIAGVAELMYFPLFGAFGLVSASAVPLLIVGWLTGASIAAGVLSSHLMLFVVAALLMSLGLCVSSMVRDEHAAAGLAYLVVLALAGAPIFAGPLITQVPEAEEIIHALLLTNPFSAVATTIDYDIARSEVVYVWSPIGQRRFTYPSTSAFAGFYTLVSGALLAASVWRVHRLQFNAGST